MVFWTALKCIVKSVAASILFRSSVSSPPAYCSVLPFQSAHNSQTVFPKVHREKEILFWKGKMQLAFSLSKSENPILTIGWILRNLGFTRVFICLGFFFPLLCVIKHANQSPVHSRQKGGHLHLHVSFISGSAQGTPRSLMNLMLVC